VYALRSCSIARHGLLSATALLLGAARLIAARSKAVVCFDAKQFIMALTPQINQSQRKVEIA
jgi:hypothetical protein